MRFGSESRGVISICYAEEYMYAESGGMFFCFFLQLNNFLCSIISIGVTNQ